jgi:hypothetical protein
MDHVGPIPGGSVTLHDASYCDDIVGWKISCTGENCEPPYLKVATFWESVRIYLTKYADEPTN